ncbi:hypothetical protein [Chitinimonas sp. BJYL2]|uniref:hypothetical protein n=1 Tax=Chitinimonas sp. BJYL2 TaxID=2976696 RepID=UPI0022B355AC|nr:hypothetical protein [Chitinimonas sp. BJYL2]
MNPAESGQTALHVQHIACVNNAGFVMDFKVSNRDGHKAGDSGGYPINQVRSIDVATLQFNGRGAEVGEEIHPVVHAHAGVTKEGPTVRYAPNGQTATYTVTGTTLIYSINR